LLLLLLLLFVRASWLTLSVHCQWRRLLPLLLLLLLMLYGE
jgi:hypothetical protein